MSGDPTSRRKAYRLKGSVTRDAFLTWDMNHRSFCRQFPEWLAFLPTGTRPTWTSFTEDPTRGIHVTKIGPGPDRLEVADDIETNKCRNALEEFLVCLGTYIYFCDNIHLHNGCKVQFGMTSYDYNCICWQVWEKN